MSFLPPQMQAKYLAHFELLIQEGEALLKSLRRVPGRVRYKNLYTGEVLHRDPDSKVADWEQFVEWRTRCANLLSQIVPERNGVARQSVQEFTRISNEKSHIVWGTATLRAIRLDFGNGFLGDILVQVEAEIASDYMGQAEALLSEGTQGKFDHVPAAVLAGAVLEKALRTLCERQEPAISRVKPSGQPKTISSLTDDLKKASVFSEAKAKQIRAWADIRNHAAHGEFDQFTRADVEQMISGINSFLGDYLP